MVLYWHTIVHIKAPTGKGEFHDRLWAASFGYGRSDGIQGGNVGTKNSKNKNGFIFILTNMGS